MQPNAREICADGSEMVRNWIQELSEEVRCGRLQHHADITAEREPDEDEKMVLDKWRRIEAVHMAAEGGCTVAADRRAVSTATNSRLRNSVYPSETRWGPRLVWACSLHSAL